MRSAIQRIVDATPPRGRGVIDLRLWQICDEWYVRVSGIIGSAGGIGPTPESALATAADSWERMATK